MNKKLDIIDAETLADMRLEPVQFCIENILPQGIAMISGAPKIGKSWLMLDWCLKIAKGEPVWNFKTNQGTALYLCLEDNWNRIQNRLLNIADEVPNNLFFAVSENVTIDERIKKTPVIDNIEPLVGFRSLSSRESNLDRINILISLMGDQNIDILRSIYNHFQPSDMFPVLPFPSKDPRHSDYLMLKYHEFFTEKQFTEPQNITYADEQNPFELYRIVSNMIQGHQATFKPISDHVCFGIALLTSKLLSLGALLVGLEYNNCVTIYNVSSANYEIEDATVFKQINEDSEPFLLWITGEAYNEN